MSSSSPISISDEAREGTSTPSDYVDRLPLICSGSFFKISKKTSDGTAIQFECCACQNKLSATLKATSNLKKHLQVSLKSHC